MALTREPSCEARVDHGARLVDATSDRADDPLDDLHQVPVVAKHDRGFFELAVALDVHLVVAIHEDVRDVAILQQLLERTEAEQLVEDVGDQVLSFVQAERRRLRLILDHPVDQFADLGLGFAAADAREPFEVQLVQQPRVHLPLEVLIVGAARVAGSGSRNTPRGGVRSF